MTADAGAGLFAAVLGGGERGIWGTAARQSAINNSFVIEVGKT